jgi:hypothetical protein
VEWIVVRVVRRRRRRGAVDWIIVFDGAQLA